MLTDVKRWLVHVLELLLWIVAVLTLLQVLFGSGVPEFFGIDVIGNIGDLVQKFGNAGLVGVVAAVIVSYLILRERNGGFVIAGSVRWLFRTRKLRACWVVSGFLARAAP